MRKSLFIILGFLLLAINNPIMSSIKNNIINNDWNIVYKKLEKRIYKTKNPIIHILMKHSCYFTNRFTKNSYIEIRTKKGCKKWLKWCKSLTKKHPNNSTALYLLADSYYKMRKKKKAIKILNKALKINRRNSSLYNLRGKLYYEQKNIC